MSRLNELRAEKRVLEEKLMRHMSERASSDNPQQWISTRNYLTSELSEVQRQIGRLEAENAE
jgi:hypothetical protein